MRNPRDGRPPQEYKDTLKKMSRKHYKQLERACVEAYIRQEPYVTITYSYLTRFPADFPHKLSAKRDGLNEVAQVRANRLLLWLNNKGYSDITAESLRIAFIQFTRDFKEPFHDL